MYEYFLINVPNSWEMNCKVSEMLAQGWEPFLGLTVGKDALYQWMLRPPFQAAPRKVEYAEAVISDQ